MEGPNLLVIEQENGDYVTVRGPEQRDQSVTINRCDGTNHLQDGMPFLKIDGMILLINTG